MDQVARASNTSKIRMSVKIDGLDEGIRAARSLSKEAKAQVRKASKKIADDLVGEASSRMRSLGRSAALVASSFKAVSGMTPTIKAGGSSRVTPAGATAGDVWFGAEFGGQARARTQQFRPHRGTAGYAFWPTVRDRHDQIRDRYLDAVATAAGPRDWPFD